MAEIALLFPSDSKFDTPLPQFAAPVGDKPIIGPRVSGMGAPPGVLEGGTFKLGKLTAIHRASNRPFGGIYLKLRFACPGVLAAACLGVPFVQHL